MARRFKAPRGTFDILPDQATGRGRIERAAARILSRAGYRSIATPAFEDTDLFIRGVGKSTDIVQKEMFTFSDKGDRSLTLRPEGTAPICRAYVEHGMHKWPQPVKLSYVGPFFRHERPQAGRYRQFHQIGIEAIGSESPLADAEAIIVLSELLNELGVAGLTLRLGSLGSAASRQDYLDQLSRYLTRNEDRLGEAVRRRFRLNPLRAFDAKDEQTREVMRDAPAPVETLVGEDALHFEEVKDLLGAAGISYVVDRTLVRGLDYYARTIFSFECEALGAQSEVGGGGRYDGLIEQLGGPPTPAVGWAVGIERILLALDGEVPEREHRPIIFIAYDQDAPFAVKEQMVSMLNRLRLGGVDAEADLKGRGLKSQLKHANRIGASHVLLLADRSAELKDMETGDQRPVDPWEVVQSFIGDAA